MKKREDTHPEPVEEIPKFGGEPLSDHQLRFWAAYGSAVSTHTTPLGFWGPGRDVVMLWNLVGALADRVLKLEGERSRE